MIKEETVKKLTHLCNWITCNVEVKLNVGVYQKPRAAYSTLMDNIASDPVTKMGIGKFLHYFLLDQVLTNIFFGRYGPLPQVLR